MSAWRQRDVCYVKRIGRKRIGDLDPGIIESAVLGIEIAALQDRASGQRVSQVPVGHADGGRRHVQDRETVALIFALRKQIVLKQRCGLTRYCYNGYISDVCERMRSGTVCRIGIILADEDIVFP
jgi:hypothetical protein